jgi:lipoprotein-anchoring transpeptidase ErfK/SrfK
MTYLSKRTLPGVLSRIFHVSGPLALGIPVLLLLAGCAEAPISQKYAARAALQKAADADAEALAPDQLAAAQETLRAGIHDMELQLRRLQWGRSFGRSKALLSSAIRRAQLAEMSAIHRKQEAKERAHQLLRRAQRGFEQMDWVFTYIPPRSRIRSEVSRARVSYSQARGLFGEGDYTRAATAAQQANEEIGNAYTRFSRFVQTTTDPSRSAQYVSWVKDTIAWSASNNSRVIIIDKLRRTLSLIVDGRRERTYPAELGVNGTLDKMVSGDGATPEGKYRITQKRGLRQTRWYKALLLNYPNDEDIARFNRARQRGQVSSRARPGGLIEIHGEGGRGGDWTAGCVALRNHDMDDLFDRVSIGTPVTIVGFESDESTRRNLSRLDRTASRPGAALSRGSTGAGGIQ